jgi:hypothetical protein
MRLSRATSSSILREGLMISSEELREIPVFAGVGGHKRRLAAELNHRFADVTEQLYGVPSPTARFLPRPGGPVKSADFVGRRSL